MARRDHRRQRALDGQNWARTLMSWTRSHSASVMSAVSTLQPMPALFIRTVSLPKRYGGIDQALSRVLVSDVEHERGALPAARFQHPLRFIAALGYVAVDHVRALGRNSIALARPIPDPLPVTIATSPSSLLASSLSPPDEGWNTNLTITNPRRTTARGNPQRRLERKSRRTHTSGLSVMNMKVFTGRKGGPRLGKVS